MLTEIKKEPAGIEDILAESPLVYLILYVNDLAESRDFYENKLGLKIIEVDEESAKYDAGKVVLVLNRAADYGVELVGRRDDSSDVVFMVDDINAMREALEARGVTFVRRRTYEIGLVTDFYDPNGHRLMIYQPSEVALTWPSADKIREVWKEYGRGASEPIGPAAIPLKEGETTGDRGLDGKPLIYLFMFVPTSDEALDYYHNRLGLNNIEGVHCCNPACPPEERGVVKYDVGGMLLSTHHVHKTPVVDDFGRIYSPKEVNSQHTRTIVPVFHVTKINDVVDKLKANGVEFTLDVVNSEIGNIAKFEAETGHSFYLYEPSIGALRWPTGKRLKELIGA